MALLLLEILKLLSILACSMIWPIEIIVAEAQYVYKREAKIEKDLLSKLIRSEMPKSEPIFAFAKHFQSHMVLQQSPQRANVYGFSSEIGKIVELQVVVYPTLITHYYNTIVQPGSANGTGVWNFILDSFPGNTAVDIYAISEVGTLALEDILFGDVWICSGQSNMQFTVIQMFDAEKEMAEAKFYPNIRLMTVNWNASETPLDDLIKIEENWTLPNRSTIGGLPNTHFSAVCWLFGKNIHKALGYPIGLVASDYGGTHAEAWSSPEALAACGNLGNKFSQKPNVNWTDDQPKHFVQNRIDPDANSVLWNAMIHPLLGMTIYGVLWYQGESDAYGPPRDKYNCTFPELIKDWRYNFNKASHGQTRADFPFGFVQLSAKAADPSISVGFPDIRWHQTADRGYVPNPDMPNVFMAVAMDLPDFISPYGYTHPRDKLDVGTRLTLSGLAVAYGKSELYQGPLPVLAYVSPQGLVVDYGKTWSLDVRNWDGFELLCGTRWTETRIIDTNTSYLILFNEVCGKEEKLSALRYAWRESPCAFKKCSVYENINNLPGPPFVAFAKTDQNITYFTFEGPTYV
ncbi:sialate O-acetylesterase-like [Biomphalaria glabrata]|uniref:Sialate O-acetylesterase-like n=1 Tax=Biomphalaria glabrata TaxID=6526 RepID=A0A9W3AQV1_BIOGL|nr:sialate O-acetylesterase-like [Biomphalaria glabrata]XP_055889593.1 sialate O-acetylesterase-like [Biomphalaria glabrata]